VDTIIYTTRPGLSHVSSSAAKAITLNAGKNILDYVSVNVKRRLEEELLHQYRIGITGEIGAGKSFVTELFHNHVKFDDHMMLNFEPHIVDMDCIGHYILEKGTEPIYQKVRIEVCKCIGAPGKGKFVNVKELGKIIFNDSGLRKSFNEIMLEPMQYELRKTLLKLKGTEERKSIVFITGALLVEMRGLSEFNNNLILVKASNDIIVDRLKKTRGYSDEEIKRRQEAQQTFNIKGCVADDVIAESGYGHQWIIENDGESRFQGQFDKILNEVVGEHE
jgi:dephospho-CoA kinase